MNVKKFLLFLMAYGLIIGSSALLAQIPVLNSRPGAAYTLYLDFGGFSFTGNWGNNASYVPGVTPAYSVDGNAAFSATEIANMRNIWSRIAEKYSIMNVNVTTIDPATTGFTDAQRQAFYDQTPRMMHTVIGGSGNWTGGGGVSYVGVAQNTYGTSSNSGAGPGHHTNWVFAGQAPSSLQFVAEATAHEDGHGLKLDHQSRYTGTTKTSEYDSGSGTGSGSFAPIMGNSYSAQRGTWRIGASSSSSSTTAQNDLGVLLTNNGIAGNGAGGFMDSGIGHTLGTATVLQMTGTTVNSALAKGLIAPSSTPVAIGEANYTTDLFSVVVSSASASLNVNLISGRSTITAGVADPGATLNATFRLLNSSGGVILSSSSGIFSESIVTSLPTGQYYLQIASDGGDTNNGYNYFDVGSYFLTGSIIAVPEPSAIAATLLSLLGATVYLSRRTKRLREQTLLAAAP